MLADLDKDAAAAAAKELTSHGHRAIGVACDVTDESQAAAMVEQAVTSFGRLGNGVQQRRDPGAAQRRGRRDGRELRPGERGQPARCLGQHGAELRQMREQGSGAIVNCSSLGGLVGLPERAAYHASKHGVIGLTKSVAVEYAPKGVRVNAVCPGVIDTPMVADMLANQAEAMAEIMKEQPIGRLGSADEIAAAVLWLCSPGCGFRRRRCPPGRRRLHRSLTDRRTRKCSTEPAERRSCGARRVSPFLRAAPPRAKHAAARHALNSSRWIEGVAEGRNS